MSARAQSAPRGAKWRTSETGGIRFNRDFTRIGVGRITLSSRTNDPKEFQRRDQLLTKLADNGQIDVLLAFKRRDLTIEQILNADREKGLKGADLLGQMALRKPLWTAVEETLPLMGASASTRKRYEVSLKALRHKAALLTDSPSVADLERLSWQELRKEWGRSPADWNHLRRAVSAFLTAFLRDKFHPFRRAVVTRIPTAIESARVPDVTPEVFLAILKHVPKRYQCIFITLVVTGMRVGEYLRCTAFNLKPATLTVSVPGTKTSVSAEDVAVHRKYWRSVAAAVPAPIGYKALRRHWKAACEAAGVDVHIHDLRHCFGQWAVNAGVAESKVQSALRHKTASMTRRYTRTKEKGDAANAVGEALLLAQPKRRSAQIAAQGGKRA
jgi:integrase